MTTSRSPHLLDGLGLWAEVRCRPLRVAGPVLLLDRDGVINDDVGYVGRPEHVRILADVGAGIAACNAARIPVAIVTNQAGIARRYYDWAGFAAVQGVIDEHLAESGARVDAVFACAYHEAGEAPLDVPDHPWRKPRPGMLNAALDLLNGKRTASGMMGDKELDMAAARAAGVAHGYRIGAGGWSFADAMRAFLDTARPANPDRPLRIGPPGPAR